MISDFMYLFLFYQQMGTDFRRLKASFSYPCPRHLRISFLS